VVRFERDERRLGGAANVARNLQEYGARVTLVGVAGCDDAGESICEGAQAHGIDIRLVRASDRPTTRKMRIVTTRHQQVARVDYEADGDVAGDLEAKVIDRLAAPLREAEAVIASDYLKGVVSAGVMRAIVSLGAPRALPILVDPKIPHIDHYAGATLVTPNHHEAEVATAIRIRTDEDARSAARAFRERSRCGSVLITRGERGMWLLDGTRPPEDDRRELALEAVAREVSDVTGAGDTVIATLAMALAAGASLADAARLANHAAGRSVAKFGPATVSCDELKATLPGHSVGP
jgi:D-beta-D-heptose 7-phosphate kinase/D-beta-D-heptose 1-phosphate adenosyltransferase